MQIKKRVFVYEVQAPIKGHEIVLNMSSLQVKVEKQIELCLKFIYPNVVMLKYSNLSMTIEHVEDDSPSQRVYLQKIGFKKKVE